MGNTDYAAYSSRRGRRRQTRAASENLRASDRVNDSVKEKTEDELLDFRERYELPDGLIRQYVPTFDEIVVRELLVNALVHRPYTQRGDIFLNLHPDRLEVVNPGPLPPGVTPQNVVHTSVRRNEHFARLFHDLKLMEREGSGFDKIFAVLLSQGRPAPELIESHDRVQITVYNRILKPEVIDFIAKADQTYQLTQRIGGEMHLKQVKRAFELLFQQGAVHFEGSNRWRRYWAVTCTDYRTNCTLSALVG